MYRLLPLHALLASLVVGCQNLSREASDPPVPDGAWEQLTALHLETKLGGCAVGDFDPDRPGNEIAVVAGDGRVLEIFVDETDPSGFAHELMGTLPGEPIQCAVGDLLPGRPGVELVTVGVAEGGEHDGGAGLATLWLRDGEGGSWEGHTLLEDQALIHGVAVGELDPDRPGAEVVLGGFSGVVHVGTIRSAGDRTVALWEHHAMPASTGNVKGISVGPEGARIGCDDGSLLALDRAAGSLGLHSLCRWEGAPLARLASDADGVLVASNDGVLRYSQFAPDTGTTSTVVGARADDRLRGAVIADLSNESPGTEWATAGYDGRILVIERVDVRRDRTGVLTMRTRQELAGQDDDRLHHLAAGELPGLGTCLVAVGYSGRVTVLRRAPVAEAPGAP